MNYVIKYLSIIFGLVAVLLSMPATGSAQSTGSYVCNRYNDKGTGWCGYVNTIYDKGYRIELTKVVCNGGNFLLPCTNLRPETCSGNQTLYTLDSYRNPDFITVPKWCVNGSSLKKPPKPKDYSIKLTNACSADFIGFARYKNFSGNWVNTDWFRQRNDGKRYSILDAKTKNTVFYLYLEYGSGKLKGQPAKLKGKKITRSNGGKDYEMTEFSSKKLPTGVRFCKN